MVLDECPWLFDRVSSKAVAGQPLLSKQHDQQGVTENVSVTSIPNAGKRALSSLPTAGFALTPFRAAHPGS